MKEYNKVYCDARWMVGARTRGMGRYAEQLIEPAKNCTVAVVPSAAESHHSLGTQKKGHGFFPWWEQVVLPRIVEPDSILLCPYNTGPLRCFVPKDVVQVVVVHDLIYLEPLSDLPMSVSVYQNLGRLYRRLVVPSLIKSADLILTVSQYSKKQIVTRLGVPPAHIKVIPNSLAQHWFQREPSPLDEREDFILTVTGESPSKNVDGLLRGYAYYRSKTKSPLLLKLAGVAEALHSKFIEMAAEYGLVDSVEFVGHLSDEQLMSLYQSARIFVFASRYEGFGIPLLEAMASGVPIACSNCTSIPEVVGDAALLFDPVSEKEIGDQLLLLQENTGLAAELVERGKRRVQLFKYETVQAEFVQLWSELGVN